MFNAALARPDTHPIARPAPTDETTLADLAPGALAKIVRVEDGGSPATARRLADLGLTSGAEVRVLRRAPLRDPVLYRIKDYDLCLRRAQAACVRVVETR